MREALDQQFFVAVAYAIGIGTTLALVGWSWLTMRAAERRRDRVRGSRPAGREDRTPGRDA